MRLARSLLVLGLVALVVAWIAVDATGRNLDFIAFNGAFQNFNPMQRMRLGQTPGSDFQPYLGLWVTHLLSAAMGWGTTLGASMASSRALCGGLFFAFTLLLGGLARLSMGLNVALAAALFLHASGAGPLKGPGYLIGLQDLAKPTASVLLLRAAAPFLAACVLLLLAAQRKLVSPQRMTLVCALMAGLLLPWSNDYGFATAACLYAFTLLQQPRAAWLRTTLFYGSVSAAVGAGTLLLLTHGRPWPWLEYNFLGVARDQFWYFQGHKILELEVPPLPLLWVGGCCMASLYACTGTAALWDSPQRLRRPLLTLLGVATLLGGTVSSMGSIHNAHYFAPAYWVTLYMGLDLLRLGWAARRRLSAWHFTALPVLPVWAYALALACSAALPWLQRLTPHGPLQTRLDVPQLGGHLAPAYDKMLALGTELRAATAALPATERLFSTYATALDVLAGAQQPTGHDYIIHALGPAHRQAYNSALANGLPPFATTLRESYTPWETWSRRVNWDFYRVLLAHYRPMDQTFYNTVWERHPGGVQQSLGPVQCTLQQVLPHRVSITLAYPGRPSLAWGEVRIVEVDLSYRAIAKRTRILHGGLRQLTLVRDIRSARFSPTGTDGSTEANFNLPPAPSSATATSWRFPVEIHPEQPAVLEVEVLPAYQSELWVDACTAVDVVGKDAVDAFPLARLHAAAETGIGAQSFRVSDATDLRRLKVGQWLRFAASGLRQVVQIDGDTVRVDGPLSAAGDGYPRAIQAVSAGADRPSL